MTEAAFKKSIEKVFSLYVGAACKFTYFGMCSIYQIHGSQCPAGWTLCLSQRVTGGR